MIEKPERQLSEFFAENLTLEHLQSHLDPERERAFQKIYAGNAHLQKCAQDLTKAKEFFLPLKDFKVSSEVLRHYQRPQTASRMFLDLIRFDEWPLGLKWSLESLVVLSVVMIVALIIPWSDLSRIATPSTDPVVLSEYARHQSKALLESREGGAASGVDQVTYPDEAETIPSAVKVDSVPAAADTKSAEGKPAPAPVVATKPASSAVATESESTAKGYLFRGQISVTNAEAVSPKFVEKIMELGGRKAGEVPLGWKKGSGSYFHFTIPESKYETLMNFMREFGEMKIQRERHERVMPEGIVRLIIQVEEK